MRQLLTVLVVLAASAAAVSAPESPDAALEKALAAAKADASGIRGLSFKADIRVRKITPDEFRKEIMLRDVKRIFGEGETLRHMETLLATLRVIPKDMGLLDLAQRFFPETVAANYDPLTKQISFLRTMKDPSVLHNVMVHELTHALQDQNFDLTRMLGEKDFDFDRLLALGALVEGDAEDVQRSLETAGFLAMTPLETIRAFGQSQAKQYLARMKDFPRGVARPFIFQYLDGLLFVETVKRARDGFPAIDRAYRDPPESTEQILHPGKYLVRDHPVTIALATPPEGYRVLLANTLGELGLSIVLTEHVDATMAETAAAGWGGDRIMLLARGEEPPVLVWYTTWDSADDAREFAGAATEMLKIRHPGLEVRALPEESLALEEADGRAHFLYAKGKAALLVEGLPAAERGPFLAALLKATESRVVVAPFGSAR